MAQHVLVQKVTDGEHVRMIANGHHRDDLAAIQKQRQRAFHGDRSLDRIAVLIDSRNALGQLRVGRIGPRAGLQPPEQLRVEQRGVAAALLDDLPPAARPRASGVLGRDSARDEREDAPIEGFPNP